MHDLKTAVHWLGINANLCRIDTTKIAVLGCSAGGQLAALLGTTEGVAAFEGTSCFLTESIRVQAVVDINGILAFIHPQSGEGADSRSTSAATYCFSGFKTEWATLLNEASTLT